MSDQPEKISQLPDAPSANLSDLIPATQGSSGPGTGVTRHIPAFQYQALFASGFLSAVNNLSDVANAATALANLGGAPVANAPLTGATIPTAAPGATGTGLASLDYVLAAVAAAIGAITDLTVTGLINRGAFTPNRIIFDSFTGAYAGLVNYTAVPTDCIIIVNKVPTPPVSSTGPTIVTVPDPSGIGFLIVLDGKGDAATNNISISTPSGALINGGSPAIISNAFGGAILIDGGSQWIALGL